MPCVSPCSQVLLVGPANTGHVAHEPVNTYAMDLTAADGGFDAGGPFSGHQPGQAESIEAPDGVTPFMRMARKRNFRPPFTISPAQVQQVENMVLDIVSGR